MPSDDLWQLYEQVSRLLTEQLTSEKRKIEQRLSQLRTAHSSSEEQSRSHRKVHPRTPLGGRVDIVGALHDGRDSEHAQQGQGARSVLDPG
jgi:hypothetical protein